MRSPPTRSGAAPCSIATSSTTSRRSSTTFIGPASRRSGRYDMRARTCWSSWRSCSRRCCCSRSAREGPPSAVPRRRHSGGVARAAGLFLVFSTTWHDYDALAANCELFLLVPQSLAAWLLCGSPRAVRAALGGWRFTSPWAR